MTAACDDTVESVPGTRIPAGYVGIAAALCAVLVVTAAAASPVPRLRVGATAIAPPGVARGRTNHVLAGGTLYDNTGNPDNTYYAGQGGAEAIDDLHLVRGGSVDTLVFEYYDPAVGGTLSATVTIYGNPGGLDLGTTPLAGPYTVSGLARGRQIVAVPLPDAPVVGTDVWVGVQFSSATAGWIINNVPSVGVSHDLYLENGNLFSFGGDPKANFAVRLIDVPLYRLNATTLGLGTVTKSPDLASYLDGAAVQLNAAAAAHWHFVGWGGDASGADNPLSVTMDGDKSIVATFAIDTHTLTVNVVGNGTVGADPPQAAYDHGTLVTLTPTPATGWHFAGWGGDAAGNANPLVVTMDGNQTITATFAINTYTLAVTPVGNGTVAVNPQQASYDHGTPVTLTATPATGWHFVGWSGDASGAVNPLPVVMDGSKSITATFAIDRYSLTVTTTGSGAVVTAPVQAAYDYGTLVALTPVPTLGWHFVAWSGDTAASSNPLPVPMIRGKTITATFAINTYTLSVTVIGNGTVGVSPAQATYDHGTPVTLSASAAAGSHFVGWSGDTTAGTSPLPVAMIRGKAITATFALNSYVLSSAGFETGLTGWEEYGGGTLAQTSPGHGGSSFAALLTGPGSTAEFGLNDSPAWLPDTGPAGTHYRVTAWVRSDAGHGTARIRVRDYFNDVNQQTVFSPVKTLSPAWQQLVLDIFTLKAHSLWDLQVLDQPTVAREAFQADDLMIEVLTPPVASVTDDAAVDYARPVVFPNPAAGRATLGLSLARPGRLRVELFDVTGRAVRVLANEAQAAAGTHRFSLTREHGARLGTGIYFYRADVAGTVHRGRFVILD